MKLEIENNATLNSKETANEFDRVIRQYKKEV